jgi:hypothetical protein
VAIRLGPGTPHSKQQIERRVTGTGSRPADNNHNTSATHGFSIIRVDQGEGESPTEQPASVLRLSLTVSFMPLRAERLAKFRTVQSTSRHDVARLLGSHQASECNYTGSLTGLLPGSRLNDRIFILCRGADSPLAVLSCQHPSPICVRDSLLKFVIDT